MSIANKYFLYLLSLAAYAYALTQPLFTTSGKLIGFEFSEEQITFFKTIEILEEQNYQVLKIALLVFVIGLPVIKFFTLLFNINNIILFTIKFDQLLISLQKYAMVDVFVIALLLI